MSETLPVRVIITGGTFDKRYCELKGELTFEGTHLPDILKHVRCTVPLELEINQLVDSLHMLESGRASILDSCRQSTEDRIVITHGTDTMVETATLLGQAGLRKTIVLTGAIIPYAVHGSDAVFNIGCALAAVQCLPRGVYIAMNGRIFSWDNVRKNRGLGVFQEKRG
jgi:L-asparaginase